MKCIYCKSNKTSVIESREQTITVRRRRECLNCKKRFTTYERTESSPIYIIKKDNSREKFDREKIKAGILKACEKRPVSIDKIDETVNDIELKLMMFKSNEIKSSIIGENVMKALHKLDKVAYIRFASVYRNFQDISDFKHAIREV